MPFDYCSPENVGLNLSHCRCSFDLSPFWFVIEWGLEAEIVAHTIRQRYNRHTSINRRERIRQGTRQAKVGENKKLKIEDNWAIGRAVLPFSGFMGKFGAARRGTRRLIVLQQLQKGQQPIIHNRFRITSGHLVRFEMIKNFDNSQRDHN